MRNKSNKKPDFSESAVKKAVVRNTLEHPAVLYPSALGVLGGFSLAMFGISPILIALAAGGASVAFLSWLINYGLRRNDFANKYIKQLHQHMEAQRTERIKTLRKSLKQIKSVEGDNQFQRITEKYEAFVTLLGRKLDPVELTYGRYLAMAEQVYLGALDNLQQVVNTLGAVAAIDAHYTQKRLSELQQSKSVNGELQREIKALTERLQLYESQQAKVNALYAQNEEAMTKLDLTTAALSDMRTEEGGASMDLELAMQELQRLAERAKEYS